MRRRGKRRGAAISDDSASVLCGLVLPASLEAGLRPATESRLEVRHALLAGAVRHRSQARDATIVDPRVACELKLGISSSGEAREGFVEITSLEIFLRCLG